MARLDKAATLDRGCWGEAFHFVERAAERQGLMEHSRNRPAMIQHWYINAYWYINACWILLVDQSGLNTFDQEAMDCG